MKLSVTMIVRNEEQNLARLLPQLGFADEIVVVDTGSTDNTKQVASRFDCKVFDFVWVDDFAAARNHAISKAHGEFVMWLDADDVLPQNTQKQLLGWKNSPQTADTYFLKYRIGDNFWFWRERIVRRCKKCRFVGFIHEAIVPFGKQIYLDADVTHCPSTSHEQRNLAIYRKQRANGRRFSLRDNYYFARTLAENGLTEEAIPILTKFATNNRSYVVDRVGAYKLLANFALKEGKTELARRYLGKSIVLLPPDSEICCLMGNGYFAERRYALATEWYLLALNAKGSYGFVDGYYREFLPNVQLSVCMWQMGNVNEGRKYHQAAKAIHPDNPIVVGNERYFAV